MRLPRTLALLRRPRRAAVRTVVVRAPAGPSTPPRQAAPDAGALRLEPYVDLAQRVREVGEW